MKPKSHRFTFGEPLYRYDVVGSTQDVAREWVARGAGAGTVVTARAMTAGRGRRGRVWHVPPGANVCLTAVGPPVAPDILWQVALVAGLAVVEAVERVAPSARAMLRFPNDVYAEGKKLSGVLVEAVPPRAGTGAGLIPLVGIGVNVQPAPLPPEVAERAVSLEEVSGVRITVEEVETALLARLTDLWEWWRQGIAPVLKSWKARADAEAWRTFLLDGTPTRCRVLDITPDGTVSLAAESGEQHCLRAAQVILGEE
jgi:BirA family biotin operon repressor/biotin-[acetyl-CoA-carboxylase] ligase